MNVTSASCRRAAASVEVFGELVSGLSPEQIAARGVALVPQGRRIFKSLTVRENLIVAARKPAPAASTRRWTIDTVFAHVPAPEGAPQPDRGATCPAASSRCWRSAAR